MNYFPEKGPNTGPAPASLCWRHGASEDYNQGVPHKAIARLQAVIEHIF
jgi:hypothetical protein